MRPRRLSKLGKHKEAAEMLSYMNAILNSMRSRTTPQKALFSQELEVVVHYLAIESL
jgi:hypothetical protein